MPSALIVLSLATLAGMSAAIPFPQIDPIAIQTGPIDLGGIFNFNLAIRWYGLAYMAGLLLGWLYVRQLLATPRLFAPERAPIAPDQADMLLLWATLGVVLGGRLGFVLFYEPSFFFQNPQEIIALWNGGMAFHGGLVGTGIAMFIFARMVGAPFLSIADLVSAAVPIGLFFGRIANFINAEVYGRPTDLPWAIVFPKAVLLPEHAEVPRHPSQLYEATAEGIILFAAIAWVIYARGALRWPGYVTGVFLAGYGIARIVCEFFRAYDISRPFTFVPFESLPGFVITTGMIYSVPMVLLGLWLINTRPYAAEAAALDDADGTLSGRR